MNKILLLIALTVGFFGCERVLPNHEIDRFTKEFERDTGVKVERVNFFLTNLSGKKVGTCYPGIKLITLDKSYYNSTGYFSRKALVYHELGHCVCNILTHVEPRTTAICQDSLMVPAIEFEECYKMYWDKYVRDLKARCK